MSYSQSEKMEIIRLVEDSSISVHGTLKELGVSRSTFYKWYRAYCYGGFDGLVRKPSLRRYFWNGIPDFMKKKVLELALSSPEKSSRELAWLITDDAG